MPAKFTNNAFGTLASSISNVATSITLSTGNGARFPALSAGEFFYATLVDASNNLEIIQVTARSTDTLTVVRGQDGTTGRAYAAGDRLELRPVAAALTNMVQKDGTNTFSGTLTSSGGSFTGSWAGTSTFSGNVTFSNTITGSVSGNAGTVTNGVYTTGNQTIGGTKQFTSQVQISSNSAAYMYLSTFAGTSNYNIEQGWDDTGLYWNIASTVRGVRWIKNGSTNLVTIDSSGNLAAIAGITAGGTLTSGGAINEKVFTITDGASVDLNPANGTIQLWTLGANRSPTASSFAAGQAMTLMVLDGTAFAITWPSVTWVGGAAPTLDTTKYTVVQLWKVGTTLYGAFVGYA